MRKSWTLIEHRGLRSCSPCLVVVGLWNQHEALYWNQNLQNTGRCRMPHLRIQSPPKNCSQLQQKNPQNIGFKRISCANEQFVRASSYIHHVRLYNKVHCTYLGQCLVGTQWDWIHCKMPNEFLILSDLRKNEKLDAQRILWFHQHPAIYEPLIHFFNQPFRRPNSVLIPVFL